MKKIYPFLVILLFAYPLFPQEGAGKIISRTEAESLFSKANLQIQFSYSLLKKIASNSKNVLITIIEDRIIIADQDKKILFPEKYELKGDEIFHLYNSPIVLELLNKSEKENILIEKRGDVLTLTNEEYTLEYGLLCPPYCY